jgi:hypothetical protein
MLDEGPCDLNVVSQSIATVTDAVISVILRITGHA